MHIPTLSAVFLGLCLTAVQADINAGEVGRAHARDISVVKRDVGITNSFNEIEARGVPALGRRTKGSEHSGGSKHGGSSPESFGSSDTSKLVAMGRIKESMGSQKIQLVGINGCMGLFLFSDSKIVGAHVNPQHLNETVKEAIEKAGRGVTHAVIYEVKGSGDAELAKKELEKAYPGIHIDVKEYNESAHETGHYTFTGEKGKPNGTELKYHEGKAELR